MGVGDFQCFLYVYTKQLILSHRKISKALLAIMTTFLVLSLISYKVEITSVIYDALAMVMYLLLVIVFAPKEDVTQKRFPVEIFGFTYAVILMFYSAGSVVFDVFYTNDFFKEDYVASQSQILERNSMEVWGNIILNGTDVLTITAVLGYVMQKFMEK